ncbi:MAG: hypothetical protein JNK87_10220 [Bryobacterales bacterium]|nr:hypothetical protein [Bryobacterales bacterium]
MRLLALHTMGHDTGLALFDGARLEFAVETERISRIRHDSQVQAALDHLWEATGLAPWDIDFLAFSTNVRSAVAQVENLAHLQEEIAAARLLCAESTSTMLGRTLPCLVVAHEVCHAMCALHVGGWPARCVVAVNEGRGTFSRNCAFLFDGCLMLVDRDSLPWYSTGFGWSAIGYLLGFGKTPSAAGSMMAMPPYGGDFDACDELIRSVAADFAYADRDRQRVIARPLVEYVEGHPGFADRASLVGALQRQFTEVWAGYCESICRRHAVDTLALSGGCALNLPANTVIREQVPKVTIPPHCNDAGQAMGAALFALQQHFGITPEPFDVYRCGRPLADAEAAWAQRGLSLQAYDPRVVARRLAAGQIIAYAQGRSELGPRALGHRSLLGSARVAGMRRRMSEGVKGRQWYRPLACVMRDETFAAHFPGQPLSPYMLYQYRMPAGLAAEATHADGTSRIQTVARCQNPRLWELLREFEAESGEVGLINTSLNGPGKPIAYTAANILEDFAGTEVAAFVLNDCLAARAPGEHPRAEPG